MECVTESWGCEIVGAAFILYAHFQVSKKAALFASLLRPVVVMLPDLPMPMVISYDNLSVILAYLLGLGQWDRIRMKSSLHLEMPKMSSISLLTQDHIQTDQLKQSRAQTGVAKRQVEYDRHVEGWLPWANVRCILSVCSAFILQAETVFLAFCPILLLSCVLRSKSYWGDVVPISLHLSNYCVGNARISIIY